MFCEFRTNLNGTYLDITQKFPLFLQVSSSFTDLWKLPPVQIVSISLPQGHTFAFFKQIYAYLCRSPCCSPLFSGFTGKVYAYFFSPIHFSLNLKYLAPYLYRHAKLNGKLPVFMIKTTFYMESMQLYTYIWGFNKGTAFTCLLPTPRTGGGSVLPSVGQATGWG